jgi:hypothetical protein
MLCQAFSRRRAVLGTLFIGLALAACKDPVAPNGGQDEPSIGMVRKLPPPQALAAPNVVTDWAGIVPTAINNPAAPRPPASSEVLHATIALAMYDAAMAIEGGYQPFTAVATAAYLTARARVLTSQFAYLDAQYAVYLAGIPDGQAKTDGILVGEGAAQQVIALRANDGFDNVVLYQCSAVPAAAGEFEPNGGCGTQPVDAKMAQIRPFTFADPSQFRPSGPDPLTSSNYTADFIEVRDYGRANSAVRTPAQTDVAYFWSENA